MGGFARWDVYRRRDGRHADAIALKQAGIQIQYEAGYATPPMALRQAMLLLIGHWYQNREAVQVGSYASVEVAQTVRVICNQYRTFWF